MTRFIIIIRTLAIICLITFISSLLWWLVQSELNEGIKPLSILGVTNYWALLTFFLVMILLLWLSVSPLSIADTLQPIANLFTKTESNRVFSREGNIYVNTVNRVFNLTTLSYDYHFQLTVWEAVNNTLTSPWTSYVYNYTVDINSLSTQVFEVEMTTPRGTTTPPGRIDRFQQFLRFNTEAPYLMATKFNLGALDARRFRFVLNRVGNSGIYTKPV